MNVKLLVAVTAITAFGIASAQAQPSYGQTQQNDSVRGSAGASGSARTPQKVQPRGSTNGTVGRAPGRGGVNAGAAGSANTPAGGANVKGGAHTGGSMR